MFIFDGQIYESENEVPSFGSIRCVSTDDDKRNYILKEEDVDKLLSLINYVGDGSTARVVDGEQDFYTFLCGEWYK